jgi:hypothetical protein
VYEIEVVQECDTRKQLSSKGLDVRARKWGELVDLQEVKHALPIEIGDDANMLSEVKALPQVYALIAVVLVILR